ncbi:ExbD/TolR family protein [Altererythrobacter sp. RZ02]|uniref:ExbD/TolR family protein n=1 Tax=Pontixanthobacter rizhaonensis TaxID=2730337 RepID=A0A848QNG2_9SPHN|nr:ExbD/TolR family protein [Pontixanthobacter rizhaonensis]NMW32157.1 ExbD/TolR family protein [Pontixanthobacter rizhaonensis]
MGASVSASGRRGGGRRSKRAPMAEINVTPFVDVMLVLLIIFMVTAPLLASGVPVELPDSRAAALPEERDPVTIVVASDGVIYLDNEPLPPGVLPARLTAIRPGADGKLPAITLRADQTLDYGRVMGVMGELNRAGFTSIQMVTNGSAVPPPVISGSGTEQ